MTASSPSSVDRLTEHLSKANEQISRIPAAALGKRYGRVQRLVGKAREHLEQAERVADELRGQTT